MRPLAELQRCFAAALLDPGRSVPPQCGDSGGRSDAQRFAVYRNNVASSLIEALEAAYPVVRRLVGEEFFRAAARIYALSDPPRSPIMLEYGGGFADFLAHFEPLSEYPYLVDVARIERAWLEAYHAAEAEPLAPVALANVAAQRAADLCFTLHPSVRLVHTRFPALTLWRVNATGAVPPALDLEAGTQEVLIARPAAEVEARLMPPGGAPFLRSLARGEPLADAAAAALAACESFDLTVHLTALLESGLVTGARLRRRRSASNRKKTPTCR